MTPASIAHNRLRWTEQLCWWLTLVLTALFLTVLQVSITAPYGLTTLHLLAHFNAVEPFQHRVLIPLIVAAIEHIVPLGDHLTFGLTEIATWIVMILLAEKALADCAVSDSRALRRTLALTLMLPLAIITLVPDLHPWPALVHSNGVWDIGDWKVRTLYYYPYDLPAAAFTLALFLALNRLTQRLSTARVVGLFVLFAVGTVNRETTVFVLPMAALMFFGHPERRRLFLILIGLGALYFAIQLPLLWYFSGQPNPHSAITDTPYEIHIYENWLYMKQPFYAATEIVRFLGGLWLPLILWWRFVDKPLRAAIIGYVPLLVVSALIVGRLPEHRIFIEAVPLVWLAVMQAVVARIRAGG